MTLGPKPISPVAGTTGAGSVSSVILPSPQLEKPAAAFIQDLIHKIKSGLPHGSYYQLFAKGAQVSPGNKQYGDGQQLVNYYETFEPAVFGVSNNDLTGGLDALTIVLVCSVSDPWYSVTGSDNQPYNGRFDPAHNYQTDMHFYVDKHGTARISFDMSKAGWQTDYEGGVLVAHPPFSAPILITITMLEAPKIG